jgi:peptidyl-tRNA hydrolase, PTH1 family
MAGCFKSSGCLKLVVGLGNPGNEYRMTRHNAGFMVIDEIARQYDINLNKNKFNALFGRGRLESLDVILAKPMSYMNRSDGPVFQLASYYKISNNDLYIIHDDMDLAFGKIKIKEKGGHGGHRGIKSVINTLKTGEITRIRIGVGRPDVNVSVTDHVLNVFRKDEEERLERILVVSQEAVVTVLCEGAKAGMDRFNNKAIL